MKIFKNLFGLFGKILFAKFSSEIVLKVSRVKFEKKFKEKFEDILGRYGGISEKVWKGFLEILWKVFENMKIFKEICERFVGIKYWTKFSRNFKNFQ